MTDKELLFFNDMVHSAANILAKKKIVGLSLPFMENHNYDADEEKIPQFNPIYKESICLKHDIEVHARRGVFPYKVLKSKAPNQSPEEWEYQKGLYESYTNSTWNRAKNKTKIVANDQNYSIEGWDQEQKKYFYEDYPDYHSLLAYFFDIVREKKIDYPNQILLIKPKEFLGYYDDEGRFIPNQTDKIKPIVCLVEEENIIQFKENEYLLVLTSQTGKYYITNERSEQFEKNDGLEFVLYDKNSITIYRQTGIDKDYKPSFEGGIFTVYEHNWGFLPARKLGGKPVANYDGNILYHSCYIDAVPDLNAVIRLSSNLDMSTYRLAFPIIIAVVDKCRHSENGNSCTGGQIYRDSEWQDCPVCKGSGKRNNHSPTGVYEITATEGLEGENKLPMNPPVAFAAPSSEILKYISEQIDERKKNAFSFLFETDKATNETATGKQLEKEEYHSFLIQFSNELFNLLSFAIEGIGFMRYGSDFKMPSIRRPTYFNFRTNEDITLEIGEANKNSLPISYRKRLIMESNNTRFNNNPRANEELEFIIMVDPIWWMQPIDIRAGIGTNISKIDSIIHDRITTYIDNAVRINEDKGIDFWTLKFEVRRNEILLMAEEDFKKQVPVGGGQGGNALAESVGGLVGMVEIVTAVAEGKYDLEAAVKLVSSRFGISEDEARAQLGTPQLTPNLENPI